MLYILLRKGLSFNEISDGWTSPLISLNNTRFWSKVHGLPSKTFALSCSKANCTINNSCSMARNKAFFEVAQIWFIVRVRDSKLYGHFDKTLPIIKYDSPSLRIIIPYIVKSNNYFFIISYFKIRTFCDYVINHYDWSQAPRSRLNARETRTLNSNPIAYTRETLKWTCSTSFSNTRNAEMCIEDRRSIEKIKRTTIGQENYIERIYCHKYRYYR